MAPKSQTKTKFSDLTPKIGGKDLSEMIKIWKEAASSELRLKLMSELKNKKLGFNEVENFSLGLVYSLKSDKMREQKNKPTEKIVKAAMELKMKDEVLHQKELKRKKEKKRKWLGEKWHKNTLTYRRTVAFLREEARKVKRTLGEKQNKKLKHLREKHREGEEAELSKEPPGMEKFSHLSVFSENKYKDIETDRIKVPRIGEIELSTEEEAILKRNPKFAILEPLLEKGLDEEMEKAYAKIRMELRDEEKDEGEPEEKTEQERETEREKEKVEREEMARTRQIYDPETNTYDDRKRRVTDLAECSRVILPKLCQ